MFQEQQGGQCGWGGERVAGSRKREDLSSRQVTLIVLIMIKDPMNLISSF